MAREAYLVKPVLSSVEEREAYLVSTHRPEAGATSGLPSKLKRWHRPLAGASAVAVLLTLAACGGGGDNTPPPDGPAPINTLAYVDTACRDGADGFFSRRKSCACVAERARRSPSHGCR